jgi:hypothetical protein
MTNPSKPSPRAGSQPLARLAQMSRSTSELARSRDPHGAHDCERPGRRTFSISPWNAGCRRLSRSLQHPPTPPPRKPSSEPSKTQTCRDATTEPSRCGVSWGKSAAEATCSETDRPQNHCRDARDREQPARLVVPRGFGDQQHGAILAPSP